MKGALRGIASRSKVRVAMMLALTSSLVCVYGIEALLFWDPLEIRGPKPRPGFDQRGWFAVVRDLRRQGQPAFPSLAGDTWWASPPRIEGQPLLPLAGVPRSTIVLCNESGAYVTFTSDRYGFNAPDEQWDTPATVALVGDSFVEGWCVPREDSFGGQVRRAVPSTLNVGFTGHGPLAELGTLREYVAPRRPAHVFWFYYTGNDLDADLPREWRNPVLRRYLEPGFRQQLEAHAGALGDEMRRQFDAKLASSPPPVPTSAVIEIARLSRLRDLVHAATSAAASPPSPPLRFDDLRQVLAEAHRTVTAWGGTLHFVYLPDLPSAIGTRVPVDRGPVLEMATALGLDVIDLLPDFTSDPSPLTLFPYEEGRHLVEKHGLHYSRAGHQRVARRVLAALSRNP